MAFVQAQGLATWYEKVGHGPTLVLLHGWANSWEAWLPLIPFLCDHYTLILPDLPGCGKTAVPSEGWTTKQHADWFTEFLQCIEKKPIGYIGHSYGGKILLEYCSRVSVKEKLVLIDASGIPNRLSPKAQLLSLLAQITPGVLKNTLSGGMRKKIYHTIGVDTDDAGANVFQHQTLRLILPEDYTQRAKTISNKTLLIWGSQDTATPLWQASVLEKHIPQSELVVFHTGHFPHQEQPKEVSEKIIKFLKE